MNKILIAAALVVALIINGCFFDGECLQGYGPVVNQVRELADFNAVSNAGEFEVRVTMSDAFGVEVQAQENLHDFIEIYVSGSTLVVKTRDNTCLNSIAPVIVYVSMPYIEEIRNTGSGKLSADRAISEEFECSNSGSGLISIDSVFASAVSLKNSGSGKLYVTASFPEEIEVILTGSGLIDAGMIYSPFKVSLDHTGSGKIYASLQDGLEVDATLTGSGIISLNGDAGTADFGLSSSGKIDALEMVVSRAGAMISGSGKIYVYATDYLDVTISGSGDLYYRGNPLITSRITGSGNIRPY